MSYSEYKDSGLEWICEIPVGWEMSKMKFHTKLTGGFPFDSSDITNQLCKFPIIRIGNVTSGNVDVYFEGEVNNKHVFVQPNEYVLSLTGDFSIRRWEKQKSLLNQRCGLIECLDDTVIRILFYQLPFQFLHLEKTKYFTTLKNLSNEDVRNIDIVIPPTQEQQQIVEYLDHKTQQIDSLIEKTEQKIELLKEQRTALINQVVTKGLDPDAEMKDSGVEWIGEIPVGWDAVSIKRLCSVKRGSSPRPIDDQKYFDENGEFSWVRIADVSSSERYLRNTTQRLSELGSQSSTKMQPDDLFLSIAGTVGKPIITKIKCCIHDGFVWFDGLKTNPEFMYYLFTCFQCFQGLGKMGTQLNLNTDTVGLINIPHPSVSVIDELVEYLDDKTQQIDSQVEKETKRVELLKEYRNALISEVVTGKLDVREVQVA